MPGKGSPKFFNDSLKKPSSLWWVPQEDLGNHTCDSDVYISVLGWFAQGEQENPSSWLGKLVRMGRSHIPFQLKISEKWPGHQVLTSVGVFLDHIPWKLSPFSHARVVSLSSTVSNLHHCRKHSLSTFAKYHLKTQQQKANDPLIDFS